MEDAIHVSSAGLSTAGVSQQGARSCRDQYGSITRGRTILGYLVAGPWGPSRTARRMERLVRWGLVTAMAVPNANFRLSVVGDRSGCRRTLGDGFACIA